MAGERYRTWAQYARAVSHWGGRCEQRHGHRRCIVSYQQQRMRIRLLCLRHGDWRPD